MLKTKYEVFKRFQDFKAIVENQTGRNFKVLRSKNMGDYISNAFNDLCRMEGIKKENTIPYNPQQNEVADRKNMSIVGAGRAMLHDQGLPLFFWVEACNTTFYLQNKSPHRIVRRNNHEDAFTERRPNVGHFHVFGCHTYSHVPSKKSTKLEPIVEKGIVFGYNETLKAYQIYIPAQRKTMVRRYIRFEEDRAFMKSFELRDKLNQVPLVQDITRQGIEPQVFCT